MEKKSIQINQILKYFLDHQENYSYTDIIKELGISCYELRILLLEMINNGYLEVKRYSLVVTYRGYRRVLNTVTTYERNYVTTKKATIGLILKQVPRRNNK